jgi:hypothetical protein
VFCAARAAGAIEAGTLDTAGIEPGAAQAASRAPDVRSPAAHKRRGFVLQDKSILLL